MMGYVAFLQVNVPFLTTPTDYTTLLKGVEKRTRLINDLLSQGMILQVQPWKKLQPPGTNTQIRDKLLPFIRCQSRLKQLSS